MGKIKEFFINLAKDKKKLAIAISAAAVAVIAITLAIVLPLTLTKKEEKSVSQTAQSFINLVMHIKTPITLDSEADIEAGYILYDFMDEENKENQTVKENKVILDGYKAEFDVLKAAKDEEDANARQAVLRERFVNAVSNIPALSKLTADDRENIDAALALYKQLNEQSREDSSVQSAYVKLSDAESRVSQIEHEEHLAEVAAAAQEFIDGVEAIEEVTLKSIDDIEDLLYAYDNFTDEIKQFEGVADAKQKLDAALAEYRELKDADDVEKLLAYAEKLADADKVTLDDERDITNAEYLYNEEMSEEAKAAEGVAEAYAKIVAARAKYDELFAIREEKLIQEFIDMANTVPEVSEDTENVDITWFDMLDAVSDAYWNLSSDSRKLPEVEEAFERWDAAQSVFEKKYPKQIPMKDPNLTFSGHTENPFLVMTGWKEMLQDLYDFYKVSNQSELDELVTLYVYVYVEGEYVGRGTVSVTIINTHEIPSAPIQAMLKGMAEEGNDKIQSGSSFAFKLRFEDKAGENKPSNLTKTTLFQGKEDKIYTW